jgi:hypothetical protein
MIKANRKAMGPMSIFHIQSTVMAWMLASIGITLDALKTKYINGVETAINIPTITKCRIISLS